MTRTARTDDQGQRDRARSRQPDWLEPELATLTADRFSDPAWLFEPKFDGERCLAFRDGQQLRLMTRNRQQVTSTYPEIADALHAQEASDFIVDGEIVAFDGDRTSFSRLQRRLGVRDPGPALRAEVPVYLYVFDVLWAGGRDLRPLPLRERSGCCAGCCHTVTPLRYTEHRDTDGEVYWREACAKGWEGIIAKRTGSPYRPGRTRDWLKFECVNEQEFIIGGYTDPRGDPTASPGPRPGGLIDWPHSPSKTIQPPRAAAVLLSPARSPSSTPRPRRHRARRPGARRSGRSSRGGAAGTRSPAPCTARRTSRPPGPDPGQRPPLVSPPGRKRPGIQHRLQHGQLPVIQPALRRRPAGRHPGHAPGQPVPPPCAYRMHPAYRRKPDASALRTSRIKDLLVPL
jgi:ATP dependent DNA ligase domain